MQQKLKIFLAYSEVAPFTKTGGVGDVGGALPKYLKEQGHDVRVITPQYRGINERRYILRDVIRLQDIEISLGDEIVPVNVKSAFLPNSKVQVYFLDYKPFFFRTGIYGHPETGQPYDDNAERYILFSKSVLETLKKLQWQPDVIHCNNWQTALIPFLLRTQYRDDPFFQSVSSLLTVHNFHEYGLFPSSSIASMNLDEDAVGLLRPKNGKLSFLSAGLQYANYVNAVNESCYKQILGNAGKTSFFRGIINSREKIFVNIDNGTDDTVWNPETDPFIKTSFTVDALENKKDNKQALMESLSLPYDTVPAQPLILVQSKPGDEKEEETILSAIAELLKQGLFIVVLYDVAHRITKKYKQLQKSHKKQMAVLETNEKTLHQSLAGSDILLSLFQKEDTLHVAMHAMQYGTLPVASCITGIEDIITTCHTKTMLGNGEIFEGHSVKAIIGAIKRMLKLYSSSNWQAYVVNAMNTKFSWEEASRQYCQVYEKCVADQKKNN